MSEQAVAKIDTIGAALAARAKRDGDYGHVSRSAVLRYLIEQAKVPA